MAEVPIWLKKYIEARNFVKEVELFRRTSPISVEAFIKRLRDVYWSASKRRRGFRAREYSRLEAVYREIYVYLRRIAELPSTRYMNSFHRELIRSIVGDEYDRALARIRRARDLVRKLFLDYRLLVISSKTPREAKNYRREGIGRMISIVKRLKHDLEVISRIREEIIHTHVISEGLPVIVVAGPPNSGKSTLVRRLSSAEPQVAPYPFTTKNIIVGKARFNDIYFYLVDTPGLLDTPLKDKNIIEKRAITALKSLADVVVFLIDPSPQSTMNLSRQAQVYLEVLSTMKGSLVRVVPVLNKIDVVTEKTIKEAFNVFKNYTGSEVRVAISALYGHNIELLVAEIIREVKEKVLREWRSKAA